MSQKPPAPITAPLDKFKMDTAKILSDAKGEPVAITAGDTVEFYAVPTALFEEMLAFCEYAQRGTVELKNIPSNFTGEDINLDKLTNKITENIKKKKDNNEDFDEWP